MTIARIGQLTAETQHLLDVLTYGDGDSGVISSSDAFTGGYSYEVTGLDAPMGIGFSPVSQLRAGYWLRPGGHSYTNETSLCSICLFRAVRSVDSDNYILVRIDRESGSRCVELYVDSVLQDQYPVFASPLCRTDQWMHLGITIKTGVSGFVTFYVNGEALLSFSGSIEAVDFEELFIAGRLGNSLAWTDPSYVDDFYVDETDGELDSAPPPYRFLVSLPSGAGANSDWTPLGAASGYLATDDTVPDEDDTVIQALSSSLKDTYETANVTPPPGFQVRAAIPFALAKSLGGSQIKLHSYDGFTYKNSGVKNTRFIYDVHSDYQATKPNGDGWSTASFNSMQFGVESV